MRNMKKEAKNACKKFKKLSSKEQFWAVQDYLKNEVYRENSNYWIQYINYMKDKREQAIYEVFKQEV